jgi:hypothetical protein
MYHFDMGEAIVRDRTRETERINRQGWMLEPLRLCLEAQRRMRFRIRRHSQSSANTSDC